MKQTLWLLVAILITGCSKESETIAQTMEQSNSWSYTRIGKLDSMTADQVRQFAKAGQGEVTITLSLRPIYTGIQELSPDENIEGRAYTITGQIAPKGYKGIVIQNGIKTINL